MQRAIACAILAKGSSVLLRPSLCDDALAALGIARALGARVEIGEEAVRVESEGLDLGDGTRLVLDCGESGLCLRMFAAIAALRRGETELQGRGSLATRRVGPVEAGLRALGARATTRGGLPPVVVSGPLEGGPASVDGSASSQFLTGLLIALPLAPRDSLIKVGQLVSAGYVDLTLATMSAFGVGAEGRAGAFLVSGRQAYRAGVFSVEGDWSAAAFLLVSGALAADSGDALVVEGLDLASVQPDRAVLKALALAGAAVQLGPSGISISAKGLRAFAFDAAGCPDLFPPLAALATGCDGVSRIAGVSRLRNKESDRAAALCEEFAALGIEVGIEGDTLLVRGGRPRTATVDARGDHRIAMAAATSALRAEGPVQIEGAECVAKSYPGFFEALDTLRRGAS
jgi:3-phosphoshikimate 1-carboxyvinyltransferase